MIEPLQDAHTGISARGIGRFNGRRPDPNHLDGDTWPKAREIIESKYFCQGQRAAPPRRLVQQLRARRVCGRTAGPTVRAGFGFPGRAAIPRAGDRCVPQLGGRRPPEVEIASRLTGEIYLAYSKVTRNNPDGPLHFTAPQETWVPAGTRPGFRGNVVLLTGPGTISAMALMGREPHVPRPRPEHPGRLLGCPGTHASQRLDIWRAQ